MRFYKRLGVVLALAVMATLLAPPLTSSAGGDNPCWTPRPAERKFRVKINHERSSRLMGKLRLDPELSKVARVHTRAMYKRGSIFHQSADQLGGRVVGWTLLGENVGVGGSPDSLHRAFMNSPAHAANVLRSDFNHVGIGTMRRNGRLWVTVVFQARTNPGTTLRMPRC